MDIRNDIEKVLITEEQLAKRVAELGEQISLDYRKKNPVLVGILKGSVVFMADLMRRITVPCTIDFMSVSSYGNKKESSGVVRILKDLDQTITGRHVIVIEDILDSGLTLSYIQGMLENRNAASVRICTLLDKPDRRKTKVAVDYAGFTIPDEFIVGYGLDYAQQYRNLPYIGVLKPDAVVSEK